MDSELTTGLDIGCATTSPLTPLRKRGFHSTGMDISAAAICEAKKRGLHDEYIEGDLRDVGFERQYDVVACCHVIEHLPREEGEALLRKLEGISRHIVYVETPRGFLEQVSDELPQRHRSGWFAHDFAARGYTVFGNGLRGTRGHWGAPRIISEPVTRMIDRSCQWLVFRRPVLANSLAALRLTDERGNLRRA